MTHARTETRPAIGALAALLALGLAGCEGSGRFGDYGARQAVAPQPPRVQTFTPAPMGRVETSTLPPVASQGLPASPPGPNPELDDLPQPGPSGPRAPGLPSGDPSSLPRAGSSVPIDPDPPGRVVDRPNGPIMVEPRQAEPNTRVAARPDPAPTAPSGPTRTGVTGNWNAREASGGSCRVTLSSTPTLDLYKASSSGCQTRELQRVSAWELRGDEVYLYEPGGGVAARLKQNGRSFDGAAAKTGAPITLSK